MGNISKYLGKPTHLEDYIGWLANNFDPSISWKDLEWIREFWKGPMIIKGILDPQDAKDAVSSRGRRHRGLQPWRPPTRRGALHGQGVAPIAEAVGDDLTVLVDSGIRSGLDVVRMLALGAKACLLGRATAYALAAEGQHGVENLLDIFAKEMRVAMTLTGVTSIAQIDRTTLV